MSEQNVTISENAAPPRSAIDAQLVETVTTAGVNQEGLASENPVMGLDPTVIDNTVLTNAAAVVETTALTEYHDSQKTTFYDVNYESLGILDENFTFPPGFFRVVERSVPLFTAAFPNTDPTPMPWKRLDILSGLLGQDFIQTKLNYPCYIRFNLEVQLKILATNFHFGQIMVVWRPAYAPFLKGEWGTNADTGGDWRVNYPPGTWMPYGPYDTVFTASQLPHQVLPITAGTSATISLPWTLNYQYVPTRIMTAPSYHIGYLDIYLLTPILPVDIDPPRLQIFGRFKDIMGFGYRSVESASVANTNSHIRRVRYTLGEITQANPYVDATPIDSSTFAVIFNYCNLSRLNSEPLSRNTGQYWTLFAPWDTNTRQVAESQEIVTKGRKKNKLILLRDRSRSVETESKCCEKIQAGRYGEEQSMEKGGLLYNTWTKWVRTANSVATFIGSGLQALGLSKPPVPENPLRMFMVPPPIASSVVPDFTVSTSFDQVAVVENKPEDEPDVIMFEKMAAIPMYMGFFNFSPTAKTYSRWFTPMSVVWALNQNAFVLTPAGYIVQKFQFWRANFKYRLHFSSSSFVNARFSVTVTLMDDNVPDPGIVPTQYVEVKGDIVVEGEVPYLYPTPFSYSFGPRENSFRVRVVISLLDESVTWKADQAAPILMSLWISWPGLQVAGPYSYLETGIPWGPSRDIMPLPTIVEEKANTLAENVEREVLESQTLPGKTENAPPRQYGMNDIPTSVYHLSKRYVEGRGTSFTPFAPYMCVARTPQGTRAEVLVTYNPINTYFAALFRWVRGSANVLTTGTGYSMDDYVANPTVHPYHTMIAWHNRAMDQKAFLRETCTRPYLRRFGEGMIAHRQPYRSNLPYVSGPHVCWSMNDNFDPTPDWADVQVRSMAEAYYVESLDTFVFDLPANEPVVPFSYSFGDDLSYKQWMGVPVLCKFVDSSVDNFLWGPTSVS